MAFPRKYTITSPPPPPPPPHTHPHNLTHRNTHIRIHIHTLILILKCIYTSIFLRSPPSPSIQSYLKSNKIITLLKRLYREIVPAGTVQIVPETIENRPFSMATGTISRVVYVETNITVSFFSSQFLMLLLI